MNNNSMIFIGLDTHKDFNEVAYSEDERSSNCCGQLIPDSKLRFSSVVTGDTIPL